MPRLRLGRARSMPRGGAYSLCLGLGLEALFSMPRFMSR